MTLTLLLIAWNGMNELPIHDGCCCWMMMTVLLLKVQIIRS